MNRIAEYLDTAIKTGKAKNDAEIARIVAVSRATISRWRDGECAPSAEQARHLAELLEAPAGMVMAEAEAERTKDEATRAEWLRVARLCKGQTIMRAGLVALASVLLCWTGAENTAFASSSYETARSHNADSQLLRRLRNALKKLARTARGWGMLRPT